MIGDLIGESVNSVVRSLRNVGVPVVIIDHGYVAISRDGAHNAELFRFMHEFDILDAIHDIAASSATAGTRVSFGKKTDDDWFLIFDETQRCAR